MYLYRSGCHIFFVTQFTQSGTPLLHHPPLPTIKQFPYRIYFAISYPPPMFTSLFKWGYPPSCVITPSDSPYLDYEISLPKLFSQFSHIRLMTPFELTPLSFIENLKCTSPPNPRSFVAAVSLAQAVSADFQNEAAVKFHRSDCSSLT